LNDEQLTAYFYSKQYQLAIDDYTQAIQLQPEEAALYTNRGNAHTALGSQQANSGNQQLAKENRVSAINDYSDAIRLKPSGLSSLKLCVIKSCRSFLAVLLEAVYAQNQN